MRSFYTWLLTFTMALTCASQALAEDEPPFVRGGAGYGLDIRAGKIADISLFRVAGVPEIAIAFADYGDVHLAMPFGLTSATFDDSFAPEFGASGKVLAPAELSLRLGTNWTLARFGRDRLRVAGEFEAPLYNGMSQEISDFAITAPDGKHDLSSWDRDVLHPDMSWYRASIGLQAVKSLADQVECDIGVAYEHLEGTLTLHPTDEALATVRSYDYGDRQLKHRYQLPSDAWVLPVSLGLSILLDPERQYGDRFRIGGSVAPGPYGALSGFHFGTRLAF